MPFLCRVIEAVIDAGARVINIPDTVGYAIPSQFGLFIKAIREGVPNMDKATISVHCHNDLGLAVANTLMAFEHGAPSGGGYHKRHRREGGQRRHGGVGDGPGGAEGYPPPFKPTSTRRRYTAPPDSWQIPSPCLFPGINRWWGTTPLPMNRGSIRMAC